MKCALKFVKKNDLFIYLRLELNCGTCASKNHYSYEHSKTLSKNGMS